MPAVAGQASIAGWLVAAGLDKYVDSPLSALSVEEFKSLLMQVTLHATPCALD